MKEEYEYLSTLTRTTYLITYYFTSHMQSRKKAQGNHSAGRLQHFLRPINGAKSKSLNFVFKGAPAKAVPSPPKGEREKKELPDYKCGNKINTVRST